MPHVQFVRSRILGPRPGIASTILWGCLAATAPTLLRAGLDGVLTDTIFPAYYPFILGAAVVMGWRCALVASFLSALAANYMFMVPRHEFFATAQDGAGVLLFLASSGAVIFGVETLRTSVHSPDARGSWSYQRAPVSRPWSRGHGLLLGAALSLALWAGVIWAVIRLVRG